MPKLVYQQMLKQTGVYSISVLAARLSGFVMLPIYTRCLTPSDYGVIELIDLTSGLIGLLIGLRFGQAMFYFYAAADNDAARQTTVGTSLFGSILLGLIGGLAGIAVSSSASTLVFGTPDYGRYFRLMFIAFAFAPAAEVGLCYVRLLDRPRLYAAVSLARVALSVVLNVVFLVFLRMGIAGILWTSIITGAAALAFTVCYLPAGTRPRFDTRIAVRQFRYAAPLGIAGLGMFAIHFGDRFFLRHYISLADLGIYALAYKIGMLISYLQAPFYTYWHAQMFSLVKGPDGETIYVRTCTYLALGLTSAAVFMAVCVGPVLKLVVGSEFQRAAPLVPWIAGAYVVRGVGDQFRSVFLLEGRTDKEAAVSWAGAAVCLLGYAVLIPLLKVWGAVAATGITFTAVLLLGLHQAQQQRYFPFEYKRLCQLAILALVVVAGFYLVQPANTWSQAALAAGASAIYAALLLVWFFKADEKQMLRALAQTLRRGLLPRPLQNA